MSGIASLTYNNSFVPEGGLFTLQNASKLLSDFGRNGDTYVVHAKEGETVIPMEVLENNPRLKTMLFKQMRDMDLEPERYIIGNELNSINPATGQPEFFLKRLFGKVKKLVKKVAPIALPIAAPFLLPTMPLFLSTGLGSLAGSLAGGAKPRDALRNAVIAGGIAGLGNLAFGRGGFGGSAIDTGLTTGEYDIRKLFTGPGEGAPSAVGTTINQPEMVRNLQGKLVPKGTPTDFSKTAAREATVGKTDLAEKASGGILETLESGYKDYIEEPYKKYLSPSRESIQAKPEDIAKKAQDLASAEFEVFDKAGVNLTDVKKQEILSEAIKTAKTDLAPSALQKYAPIGALTGLTLYGLDSAGFPIFTTKDEDTGETTYVSGYDLYTSDPERYGFLNFYGQNPYRQQTRMVAEGGEIVGPGTSTSDSIPALLSDGEFVMNAKAVRGLGGGDRKKGASKMYAMMKQFEGRA